MFRLLDKIAGKWIDWRLHRSVGAHAIFEEPRVEEAHFTTGEDGMTHLEVIASFAPVVDLLARCLTLLTHYKAENFVTMTLQPRLDICNQPIEVTVRYASTGRTPAFVLSTMRKALMEIADWENYNGGGDINYGREHPAKIAEAALGAVGYAVTSEPE